MKHNNQLNNIHFRKDWQRYVRTWFDQPAKKAARRDARMVKAKKVAPRPVNLFRPVVRGQGVRYNSKLKLGRGFSLDEVEAAGFTRKNALSFGVSIDWRRRNKSEEDFQRNVDRLKAYKAKLVVFPRKPNSQKVKAGDSTKEQLAKAVQITSKVIIPFSQKKPLPEARLISESELEADVWGMQRNQRAIAKMWGIREKRAKEKAEQGEKAAKKASKKGE